MTSKKNIDFVRVDILENWRFWNQFAKANDYEAAGKEVIAQANALLEEDYSNERAAKLLSESREFQQKKIEAGRKGGMARANNAKSNGNQQQDQPHETPPTNKTNINQPSRRNQPPTKQNVFLFAQDHNLDVDDAREWYEINYVERPGCDKNGEVIKNWKGALIKACEAAIKKREKEQ